jgi:hypothetical protein
MNFDELGVGEKRAMMEEKFFVTFSLFGESIL